ncbi:hypothetical protein [Nocardia brasiliensis]|uniref:hypothetical protein n=1 Tax=Nocardia brasiliensis TaxID=37326 RepID=UPI00366FF7AD
MGFRGVVQQALVVVAVVLAASACGGEDGSPIPADRSTPATSSLPLPTTPPTDVVEPPRNPSPGTPAPDKPGNPPQASGTVVLKTRTLSGAPVPKVPVDLRLVQPCDPASHDIPLDGTTEVLRRDAVTDANGSATFAVPVGCYRFGMGTPPPGTTPVPEGMHSLFLLHQGQVVSGELRFQEPNLPPFCAAQTIVHDLDDIGELGSHNATVTECDGNWAVIVWDVPGDSQRIVRRAPDGWATYVYFPHDVCWTKAAADGVPTRLQDYFIIC